LKSSTLLRYHDVHNGTPILLMKQQSSEVSTFHVRKEPLIKELEDLSLSLYIVDRCYPQITRLDFGSAYEPIWKELIPSIEGLVEFLTGRHIIVEVVSERAQEKTDYQAAIVESHDFDCFRSHGISLFSGGADSTSGVLRLSRRKEFPFLHHTLTSNVILGKVKRLHRHDAIAPAPIFLNYMRSMRRMRGVSSLRGFIFLVNSFVLAQHLGERKILFPENGPMMLNPQMSSFLAPTKNAHPFLIATLQNIFRRLVGSDFQIECIYKNKTKAEAMVDMLPWSIVDLTYSCFQTQGQNRMCGACFACTVRRLSLLALGYDEPPTAYRFDPFSASSELDLRSDRIKDLHASLLFLSGLLKGNIHITDHLQYVPSHFFADPSQMFRNFALDLLVGLRSHLKKYRVTDYNALGRFAAKLLESMDKKELDLRSEQLLLLDDQVRGRT